VLVWQEKTKAAEGFSSNQAGHLVAPDSKRQYCQAQASPLRRQ
jgi:hypothetical protein